MARNTTKAAPCGSRLITDRRFIGRVHKAAAARLHQLTLQLPLSVLLDLHVFIEPMTERPSCERGPARHVHLLPDQFDRHAERIAALVGGRSAIKRGGR